MRNSPNSQGSSRGSKLKKMTNMLALLSIFSLSDATAQHIPTTERLLKSLCDSHESIKYDDMPTFHPGNTIPTNIPCYRMDLEKSGLVYYFYNPKFFNDKNKKNGLEFQQYQSQDKAPKQDVEKQTEMFCGVPIGQLTPTQKYLYEKLNKQQREELSSRVTINLDVGQIEFHDIKLAIKDKEIVARGLTKPQADTAVQNLGNGWRLPKDISSIDFDSRDEDRLTLYPEQSDYDAMILQMPEDKIENFRLLTGMFKAYRTGQRYGKSRSGFVIRDFYEVSFFRNWNDSSVFTNFVGYVRPVRSL